MSLKLRRWQQEAVSQATAKFRQGQKQFEAQNDGGPSGEHHRADNSRLKK